MASEKDNRASIAEWNVFLTDEELDALSRGVSPSLIRPEALVSYTPLTPMLEEKAHWEFVVRKTSHGHATHWEKHMTEERKPFFIDDFGHPWFLTEDGHVKRHNFESEPADLHMKAYEAMHGYWEEVVMVVLANSEEEARAIIELIDQRFVKANVHEISNDLTKPGVIFRYDR